jgi:hypothetical protein
MLTAYEAEELANDPCQQEDAVEELMQVFDRKIREAARSGLSFVVVTPQDHPGILSEEVLHTKGVKQ